MVGPCLSVTLPGFLSSFLISPPLVGATVAEAAAVAMCGTFMNAPSRFLVRRKHGCVAAKVNEQDVVGIPAGPHFHAR